MDSISEELKRTARRRAADKAARTTDVDRLPPHSVEAEQGVLGCALLDPLVAMGQLVEKTKGNALIFYDLRHQTIFNVLREMFDGNTGIDLITVQERLRQRGALEEVGGIGYLNQLQDAVPSAANLSYYFDIVAEKAKLRKLLAICATVVGRVYDFEGPVEQLIVGCEAEISKLTEEETPQVEEHISAVIDRVWSDMEQWHYTRGSVQLRGLPTGPPGNYLDKILQGIRDTHYVTVAGRPGEGKSSWAMNLVEHLTVDHVWRKPTGESVLTPEGITVETTTEEQGMPVAVFTIEMDNESLGYRLLFGRAGVSEAKYTQGFAGKQDVEKLIRARHELKKGKLWLDDSTGQTINQIAAKARRMARQHGIKLFVLDYLQLCTSDEPREEERIKLDKVSKKIMALKKQLGVPWLVLAQLNRNIETDARNRDRTPLLSDLAGSGAIEQDSDKVIIIRRTPRRELEKEPEGGGPSEEDIINQVCGDWPWDERPTRLDLWVVKNRRGPKGHAEFMFQNNLCRFEDRHLWMLRHGIEERKAGESKHIGRGPDLPSNEEMVLQ